MRQRTSNTYRIWEDSAIIHLGQGLETVIDLADLDRVLQVRWYVVEVGRGRWYVSGRIDKKTVYLHRFLTNAAQGLTVDHIDHDTLNNRISNLRVVSNQVNNANRSGPYLTSFTGVRGVSVHRSNNPGGTIYYAFRCHCVTCKVAKYFPHTDDGLSEARAFAEAHYAAMKVQTKPA